MKHNECLFLLILIIIVNQSNQESLYVKSYSTNKVAISTGTWKDILGTKVECPNKGVLKNFVLKKDDTTFWYEFQCYSSIFPFIDEGEPIIKGLTLSSSYKYTISIQENIRTLSDFPVECWIDYGLTSFKLYNDNGLLKRDAVCHGLKAKSTTKIEIKTATVTALATKIDGLVGITVGSTAQETNTNIAYPLRGFKYNIDVSSSKEKPTVSYVYGYSILRNMKALKQNAKMAFALLRNSNTQKD
jgi:hypothetical protein